MPKQRKVVVALKTRFVPINGAREVGDDCLKTRVESKEEPPLQDHGQMYVVDKPFLQEILLYGTPYILLLLYTKTPEIVKKQVPPPLAGLCQVEQKIYRGEALRNY